MAPGHQQNNLSLQQKWSPAQLIINQEELDTAKLDEDDPRTNLIINYLPQEMTEEEVRTLFSSIGTLESCKLICDRVTKASLGYAFVNFKDARDARKAIRSLQGMKLTTKTIKVSYARPSSNEIKNANLYVSGLPQMCDAVSLRELFQPYGEIITSKVLVDEKGVSRGVGFVRFDKRKQAELSIDALNNKVPNLSGAIKALTVKFANPPSQKINGYTDILTQAKMTGLAGTTTGYLPNPGATIYPQMTAQTRMLQSSPTLQSSVGTSSPFSATFSNELFNAISPQAPTTTTLQQQHQQTSSSSVPTWCVFVYNLPTIANDLTLFQLFSKHGAIHSVRVITDHEKKCRGYGFVNMVNYEDALCAIFRLNGYCLERGKPLQVSLKRPKSLPANIKN